MLPTFCPQTDLITNVVYLTFNQKLGLSPKINAPNKIDQKYILFKQYINCPYDSFVVKALFCCYSFVLYLRNQVHHISNYKTKTI